jgi:PAS domain S-box-containing protein
MQEDSGVDFITVTDDRGIVVMRTHEPRQGDSLADLVDVKAALAGAVQAVVEPGTVVKLGIRAGAPVRNEQGKIVGVVSLGYDATKDEIVDRVKQLFHTEATLSLGDERVSTTIIKDGRRVVGTKLNEPIATAVLREGKTHLGRAEILGTDYMTAYLPVMGADNRPVGVLFAGESLADFLAARNKTIMIVGFIILCFLTGVIFVTTNRLHREMADAKLALEQMVLSRTEELRKSNCFTELILENIPNAIFIKDVVNLQYVRVNRATEELLAYSRDELIGKSDDELFHKTEADSFALSDRKALRTGKLINIPEEKVSIRNNGIKWLHTKKIPIFSEQGVPEYLLGISSDISEVKKTAGALKEAEREKRLLLDSTLDMVIYHDLDLRVVWANRRAEAAAPQPAAALKGGWCWDIWYNREEPCPGCPIVTVRDTGRPQEAELISPDGRERFIRGYPIYSDEGYMIGIAEFCSDITDQKRTEQALRKSEAQYRAVVEAQTDCIYRCTPEGELIFVNDAFCRFYSVHKEAVIGRNIADLFGSEGPEALHKQEELLIQGKAMKSCPAIKKNMA